MVGVWSEHCFWLACSFEKKGKAGRGKEGKRERERGNEKTHYLSDISSYEGTNPI